MPESRDLEQQPRWLRTELPRLGVDTKEQAILREDAPGFHSYVELDDFIRREVVPVYDAMKADPSRAISIEDMKAALAEWNLEDGLTADGEEIPLTRSV